MGLIPVLLLLSNCESLLRENIDLLLIKSNYIFSPLCISGDFTVSYSAPPVYSVLFIQYHREILSRGCHLLVQPMRETVFE